MKKLFSIALLLLPLLLINCATTKILSVRHPDVDASPYKTVMVGLVGHNLQERAQYENYLINKLQRASKTDFVASHAIFNPLKEYKPEETKMVLEDNKIEAILLGAKGKLDNYSSVFYMPTFDTTTSTTSGYVDGKYVSLSTDSATQGTQAIPYSIYSLEYEVVLWDLKTKKRVWAASSVTTGDGGFAMSLSNAVIKELKKSGFIEAKEVTKKSRR